MGNDCVSWCIQGLFLDERTARCAAAELTARGFEAGEIKILNREDLSLPVPTEIWPHFEWKLSSGMIFLSAVVALLGFLRSAVIALTFTGAAALGAIIGQRAALAEHPRLRATLAGGGALLFICVHDADREDCVRETLAQFHASEINVLDA